MEMSWVMSPVEVVGSSHPYEREEKKREKNSLACRSSRDFWDMRNEAF